MICYDAVRRLRIAASWQTAWGQRRARATSPRHTPTVGLMLGVGLAFLMERLDESIKDKEDVEQAVPHLPVLGLIPKVDWKEKNVAQLVTVQHPNSQASEAYRSLRTSLQFVSLDAPITLVQVTSPNAAEGKTTTAANLAVAFARAGRRTVVVGCDLRKPRLHDFFGLSNSVGFTTILLGESTLGDALQRVEGEPNLAVISGGPPPPNPSELLASPLTGDVLVRLKEEADMVVLDAAPVLPVTDAAVLAPQVDGTILVASAGQTSRGELQRAVELLAHVNARVVGVALNGAEGAAAYGYTYGGYGYSAGATTRS